MKSLAIAVALITPGLSIAHGQGVHPHQRFFELGDWRLESGIVLRNARLAGNGADSYS